MTARDLTPNVTDCALAFEGGGYREAFSAGVATVLMDAGIRFGYVCGVSAGASNTVDYVSDDKRRVREAFMMHEAAREATGIRSLAHGHGYFDADALYEDAVTEGTLPLRLRDLPGKPRRGPHPGVSARHRLHAAVWQRGHGRRRPPHGHRARKLNPARRHDATARRRPRAVRRWPG